MLDADQASLSDMSGVQIGVCRSSRGHHPEQLPLDGYLCLPSTRDELLGRLGRHDEARAAYQRALELVHTGHERRFLERRLAEIDARTRS
jgi:predicted RNA polymerase sigma factor